MWCATNGIPPKKNPTVVIPIAHTRAPVADLVPDDDCDEDAGGQTQNRQPDDVRGDHGTGQEEPGRRVDVPKGAPHRIANAQEDDLILLELQLRGYTGEDDIVRLAEDDGADWLPGAPRVSVG